MDIFFPAYTHAIAGMALLLSIAGAAIAMTRPGMTNLKALRGFSVASVATSLVTVALGDASYIIYRQANGARSIITGGSNAWVHEIGMELKEHVAHFVPVLLAVAAVIVFYYGNDLMKDERMKKIVLSIYILSIIWIIVVFGLGVFITRVQPLV